MELLDTNGMDGYVNLDLVKSASIDEMSGHVVFHMVDGGRVSGFFNGPKKWAAFRDKYVVRLPEDE